MPDKKTIGATAPGEATLEVMLQEGHFKDAINAAHFAIAVALLRGLSPQDLSDAGTKWGTASFERLREALPALGYETTEPYRALESLLDQGLKVIQDDIDKLGHFRVSRFATKDVV
jgi:hypothetical protein